MSTERAKRKLTAILSSDVKGYSRLMGEDEVGTVETLKEYRGIMTGLIQQFKGRVVDSPGDNVLAELSSVVDAVECAVEIQKELKARNAELPENRRMEFRIGVNLGDVIEDEERIYGDGVNIAARVEGLADGGGVCISRTAYDQVKNKVSLGYEYLGEHEVKNIVEPVRVYRVLMEPEAAGKVIGEERPRPTKRRWANPAVLAAVLLAAGALALWNFYLRPAPFLKETATEETPALELPDKPSIAVLPFENLSGDPEQEYFSDGITISLITQLFKIPNMFVISKTSSFKYKGKDVDVRQVGHDLGVRFVLEGSVQRAENRIRVIAQLVDATTGESLWSESYDRELNDVMEVQDEIIRKVADEMAVKVVWGEMARSWTRATDNYRALDYYMKADKLVNLVQKESNAQARELLLKAIEVDPKFDLAMALLGWTHLLDALFGWSKDLSRSIKQAEDLANRAIAIDENNYGAYTILSRIYTRRRLYEQAIAAGERAVEAAPSSSMAHAVLALTMVYAGRLEEGLTLINKALRLSPYPPSWYRETAVYANYLTGHYETSINQCNKYLEVGQHGPLGLILWQWLICSYMELGREQEATAEARKLLELHPDFFIESYIKAIKRFHFKDYAFLDRQIELLRKAGLPER